MAAHCRQQRIGALGFDDFGNGARGDWLDIGGIGHVRISHDRCWIGIDQNDAIAIGLQCLTGLCARIVEFAGLPNNNGAGADDENRFDIVAARHILRSRFFHQVGKSFK